MLLETLLPMFALLGLATLLQTLSGFGFGLMVVSSFTLFGILPLTATTFVVSFLSLFNSVSLVIKNTEQINRRAFTILLLSGIPFMGIGYALLEYLSVGMATWLNLLLGFAILSCCGLLLVKRKHAKPSGRAYGFTIAGALGGLLGGLFSTFGPPVVFQCYRQTWPINEIRLTLLAVFSVTSLIRLAIIPFGTLPSKDVLISAVLAIPVILVFTRLGRILAARVPASSVRLLALTMLALSGVTLIVKNINF
ncbi:sulfite exporter TauE/SafE family protein [Alteromonas portus]|uniref:Probable membrane transporter protein n=1 Tax=Alteromonas portus TaxID=2565549 RepID=A0A4V5NN93_9ALTE|nr:TSUP family transporter [Alteromonas portus]TKB02806.1 sulfite exporter TauE/SafE family protein [Alteromonas portus]